MDWDKLRIFHAVAEAGSFTHAGETLNLSQSAVSRQISALEESLSVPLFHRHARGLILTEQGELLYKTARDVFSKLSMTQAMLSESKERPQGPLKVTATLAFGTTWLVPRIKTFVEDHPDIDLTVILDDNELDLGMRAADIGIRMSPPKQPDLIQRHLKSLGMSVYAHKDYLRRYGYPTSIDDIRNHTIIAYPPRMRGPIVEINWFADLLQKRFLGDFKYIKLNTIFAILCAVRSGIGMAAIPDYMVKDDTDLVKILPEELIGPPINVFFVYAEELRHSKRITVFRDFLIHQMEEDSIS